MAATFSCVVWLRISQGFGGLKMVLDCAVVGLGLGLDGVAMMIGDGDLQQRCWRQSRDGDWRIWVT